VRPKSRLRPADAGLRANNCEAEAEARDAA